MNFWDLFGEPLATTSSGAKLYMLSHEVNSKFPGSAALSEFENGLTLAEEMDRLKADLSRLERGWAPSAEDLVDAPMLKEWGILDAGEVLPRIVGDIVGASAIGTAFAEGQQIATLQVLAIDNELGWARDRRGFYRLDEEPTGEA
ncbi:hypothetical protein [Bosea sp. WAO]|uniref:hypothetical protein n=1 Tax=Bosea sp. WAO TaxID=406341 RepID=UPI000831CACD|nr:hypothetical protein [Bosea sp. WAO]